MKKTILIGFIASAAIAFASVAFAGQSPIQAYNSVNTSGYAAPQKLDANGAVIANTDGTKSRLNVTAATVVQTAAAGAQRIIRFVVTTAGAAGALYDASTTGGAAAASLIAVMPATVGIYDLNFPIASGVLVVPGSGQVVSVSYQ